MLQFFHILSLLLSLFVGMVMFIFSLVTESWVQLFLSCLIIAGVLVNGANGGKI